MIFDCDANATYSPEASTLRMIEHLLPVLSNPSAMHRKGQRSKAAIEEARERVRVALGAQPSDSIIFTSGATESNNSIIGFLNGPSDEVVSSTMEHPCTLATLARRELLAPGTVKLCAPRTSGALDVESIVSCVGPQTRLVTLMAANNETGVVAPLRTIVDQIRSKSTRAIIHTDAAQLLGKGELQFSELGVDAMTLSAHKIGALTGVGALVVRGGLHFEPLILGGSQEMKLRGGTENVMGILIFSEVLQAVQLDLQGRIERMRAARDTFEEFVAEKVPGVEFNGRGEERLPNTSSVFVPDVRADDLVVALDLMHVLISTGAACSSGKREPSHVLLAMEQPIARANGTVRVSFRADVSVDDARGVAERFVACVMRMRSEKDPKGHGGSLYVEAA